VRYYFDRFALDGDARQLLRGNDPVHLSPKALDLLLMLVEEHPRAIPKQEMYDRLWPSTYVVDGNLPVLVGEIREALDDHQRAIVRTVHGTGYAFAIAVRQTAQPEAGHLILLGDQQFRLGDGDNVVGREPAAAVCLASSSVSRRHAIISVSGTEARVTDLDSKNGTFIGSDRAGAGTLLTDGVLLRFGDIVVRYRRYLPDGITDTL